MSLQKKCAEKQELKINMTYTVLFIRRMIHISRLSKCPTFVMDSAAAEAVVKQLQQKGMNN